MMTSRSEYRLLHRQDNADGRLTHIGHRIGLISDERYEATVEKYKTVEKEIKRLERKFISPSPELSSLLEERGTPTPPSGVSLASLLRRPQLDYCALAPFDPERPQLSPAVCEQVEISIKYQGYIEKQLRKIEEFKKSESRVIPSGIDYNSLSGLRLEARQKLDKIRPENIGQASRISGVSAADIAGLMIHISSGR